jgi:hypothetical protein
MVLVASFVIAAFGVLYLAVATEERHLEKAARPRKR